jgi:hypothetical protein
MAPLLQSATTPSDGHAIVTVRGDLDTDTALQLWPYLSYPRRKPVAGLAGVRLRWSGEVRISSYFRTL